MLSRCGLAIVLVFSGMIGVATSTELTLVPAPKKKVEQHHPPQSGAATTAPGAPTTAPSTNGPKPAPRPQSGEPETKI
jgi:hypothetical protein